MTATFDIANGRAAAKDLRLDSADLDINGKGFIGLDQSIGMDVGVVLSRSVSADMVAKTARLKSFVNRNGELALDLKAGGTLQKPSIAVDPKMLKRAAEDALKKKGTDVLQRLLGESETVRRPGARRSVRRRVRLHVVDRLLRGVARGSRFLETPLGPAQPRPPSIPAIVCASSGRASGVGAMGS